MRSIRSSSRASSIGVDCPGLAEPPRPEQADVRLGQPPEREAERARRRGVEPLEVVDREHELVLGQELQGAANGDAECAGVDRPPGRVLDEEDDLERPPPRRRQGRQHLVEDAVEQVAEPGVRERALRLGGPRREHAQPAPARVLDRRAPERRLPDPGLALERDRNRPVRDRAAIEERGQRAELLLPPDDVDRHSATHRDRVAARKSGLARLRLEAIAHPCLGDEVAAAWRDRARACARICAR